MVDDVDRAPRHAIPEESGLDEHFTNVAHSQEAVHGHGHDYESGSPHLAHPQLRNEVLSRIRALVADRFAQTGRCRVLEVGAGHGAFTDHVIAMGAEVTVTEMSRPSLQLLQERFRGNPNVRLLFDADGDAAFADGGTYDLVLCVSVLHHIPDYFTFVRRVIDIIEPGGSFASFQDPLYYPRRTWAGVKADRVLYLGWRIHQGNWRHGFATQLRRFRGVLDDENPSDLVEYHVVRNGVDEQGLTELLRSSFGDVELWRYFSTQGRWLQAWGQRLGVPTTFGLIATSRT
ncbi:MAG: Methyltransferase type 12 [Pseudonocardiales bacterium]|nr:Methyltransferase type 12 [Pseudonocardiales bacterium]